MTNEMKVAIPVNHAVELNNVAFLPRQANSLDDGARDIMDHEVSIEAGGGTGKDEKQRFA